MATAKQIAADKANLVKARAKAAQTPRSAAQIAASLKNLEKAHGVQGIGKRGRAPLAVRRINGSLSATPAHRNPTGIYKKFKKRIAPSGFDTRGSWKNSRSHHFKKRIFERKKKRSMVKKWHHRKGRLTPR